MRNTGWISSADDVLDGYKRPLLRGEDSEGRRVAILEHPLNSVDDAHLNFLLLREDASGVLLEHFTFSVPRKKALFTFERVVMLLVASGDGAMIEEFCTTFVKTIREDEETPNDGEDDLP